MAQLLEIKDYLDTELEIHSFEDASLNGLQIEGNSSVEKVGVAVDAAIETVHRAVEENCQFLLVHHGLYWDRPLAAVGPTRKLLAEALAANVSLYAAHLPLDAHASLGNNACLARLLGLENIRPAIPYRGRQIGCLGKSAGRSLEEFCQILRTLPGAELCFSHLAFGPARPERVAIVSGSGADALTAYAAEGFDTLVTGESKQFAYHFAKDHQLNVIFGGHYATETVGVRAVGEALQKKFSLTTTFIDCPTGI